MNDRVTNRRGVIIDVGDWVHDPIDNAIRVIRDIDADGTTLFMEDGGCIGADEIEWRHFVDR